MAITSLSTFKAAIGTDSTVTEDRVTSLIPLVEKDYIRIRNKPFDVGTKITVSSASTLGGELDITIGSQSYNVEFEAGDSIAAVIRRIRNQLLPNAYYNITPTSNAVYLSEKHEEYTTDASVLDVSVSSTSVTTTVTKMETIYPDGAEFTAIKMIDYQLDAGKSVGISSESLGDHSITFDTGPKISDYPKAVVGGIKRFLTWQ